MACILLVDPDEVAKKAMKGILARGSHRFVVVDTASEAWDFITRNVKVDLVIVELALKGDGGLGFIQRLKNDACLKSLPVVVYTARSDRDTVRRVLDLHAQNFLLKPYRDDVIFSEIAKAVSHPWRTLPFEEEKSFCKMMGLTPEALHASLENLRAALPPARIALQKWAEMNAVPQVTEEIELLSAKAEAAGSWGVVEYLKELTQHAQTAKWPSFIQALATLDFASQLIFRHLNPSLVPDDYLSIQERSATGEAAARALWCDAVAENRCPVLQWPQLQREIEALPGCPVMESVIASFQMNANGHPTSLNPLMDLVEKDPGLAAQVLIASNKIKHAKKDETAFIEDPHNAINLLGELKLAALGRALVPVDDGMMLAPPLSSWPHFWMFQLGTARIARFTCRYLELTNLEPIAYTAGLLHDLGKLLLLRLHPFAFQAILAHSRLNHISLSAAERYFLGTTTHEMAVHFAEAQGIPRRFVSVMRWIETPEKATEDAELVAIVSLARDLCRHNHVGFCGDAPREHPVPLAQTAEWQVLRSSVFPSFDLKRFESKVHAECRELKHELHGRLPNYAVA